MRLDGRDPGWYAVPAALPCLPGFQFDLSFWSVAGLLCDRIDRIYRPIVPFHPLFFLFLAVYYRYLCPFSPYFAANNGGSGMPESRATAHSPFDQPSRNARAKNIHKPAPAAARRGVSLLCDLAAADRFTTAIGAPGDQQRRRLVSQVIGAFSGSFWRRDFVWQRPSSTELHLTACCATWMSELSRSPGYRRRLPSPRVQMTPFNLLLPNPLHDTTRPCIAWRER